MTMKKLIALLLALIMCVSLVACGGPDKQPAIDAFNAANTAFTEVANMMNENPGAFAQDLIDAMNELVNTLGEHKALLESDEKLSEEQLNEMIAWYASVEAMMAEIKAEYGIE